MCEGMVEGSGVIVRAVGPICKLKEVQGGGEDRLYVFKVFNWNAILIKRLEFFSP